jgi:hypothetical protein
MDAEATPLRRKIVIPALVYATCLAAYLGASGSRLSKPSTDNHYVYLANDLLHGRLALQGAPPHQNDWSLVYELTLKDGRKVRGTYLQTTGGPHRFKTTTGERLVIAPEDVQSQRHVYYVSFPWFPAVVMLPFVAIWGMKFNDVIFTAALGAFNPVLVFLILRRLVANRLSERTLSQDLWLVAMFAFGTVHFYSCVLGQVWYTAHVVGVLITCVYVLCALDGKHPFLAGLCLGFGFVTRTPIPFAFPLIIGEIVRRQLASTQTTLSEAVPTGLWGQVKAAVSAGATRPIIKHGSLAALPAVAVAALAFVLNYLRFDRFTEFGHSYLNVRWSERIQQWGLFNYNFVSRNLAVMFTLLPRIQAGKPYIKISWHGLGIFFTTPLLIHVLAPKRKHAVQPWLYLSVILPVITHLFYQNSGWVQFGFRFSLDYAVYLVMLLAIGGRKLGPLAVALIVFGVIVNTFGAITFGRTFGPGWDFYWDTFFPIQ